MKLIFYIAVPALGIWTLVEFILYVAHLDPFNWWSLWALIVDLILAICMAVDSAASNEKRKVKGTTKSQVDRLVDEVMADKRERKNRSTNP